MDPRSLHNDIQNEFFFHNLFKNDNPRLVDKWYAKCIQSNFTNCAIIPRVMFDRRQVGGAPVAVNYHGKLYWVNITHLVAFDEVQQKTYTTITLMHVKTTKSIDRCAIILIESGSSIATITHISRRSPYFTTDRQGTELFDAVKSQEKYGELLMHAIIFYCSEKKRELNIDRLLLSDQSDFVCNGNEIHLEEARQLMGQYPYYMKFGFKPVDPSAFEVLADNRAIVHPISAGYPLAKLLSIIKANVDTDDIDVKELLAFVQSDIDRPLTEVMRKIFNWNCLAFYYIYLPVFRALRLTSLEDEQQEYELLL